MVARNGEITLRDLLVWEPRLQSQGLTAHGVADDELLANDVDWVVTARASSPMLPLLRGGELVLLPRRVVSESGVPLAMLLQEMADSPVSGVLTDIPLESALNLPIPVLSISTITPDLESTINRLLTSRRGDLLRKGADLEHIISELIDRRAAPADMIAALAESLGIGLTISTDRGAVILTTANGAEPPRLSRLSEIAVGVVTGGWLQLPLRGHRLLWIGPLPPSMEALARLVMRQLGSGIQRALDQDDAAAPHGVARTRVLNDLLLRPPVDPAMLETAAHRAGLPIGTQLRISLAPHTMPEEAIQRRFSGVSTVHPAGTLGGFAASIIATPAALVAGRDDLTASRGGSKTTVEGGWLAVSAPIASARHLPAATRQARFVAGLLERGQLPATEIHFDDGAALGAYALLFESWGSAMLDRYVEQVIGPLLAEDRRGLLRETLRVYLEHGSAQRATADQLAIHRNTLTYRLRQIRKLLRLDPDDPGARLGLHLAVLASDLPPAPPLVAPLDGRRP